MSEDSEHNEGMSAVRSIKWYGTASECDEYIRIFKYFLSEYLFGYSFVSFFGHEYIRIFVRGKILIRIYSDIRSYQFSGHKQIQKMFLLIFSGYYTLLMDILLISMIKNAI